MTLTEFIEKLTSINKEIEGTSHQYADGGLLSFSIDNNMDDYEIKDIDIQKAPGCGCWIGVDIILNRLYK